MVTELVKLRVARVAGPGHVDRHDALDGAGAAVNTTTRSASAIASSIWWVTNSTDAPLSRQILIRKSCSFERVCTSRAAKGSSISSTLGFMARARATAARGRMPPDSSSGRLSSKKPPRPTSLRSSLAISRRCAFDTPRSLRPKVTFPTTDSQG